MGAARGELLRGHRLKAGLTQTELAAIANLSVRALRDIEQGRVSRPHPASLLRLAEALNLAKDDLDDLLATREGSSGVAVSILGPLVVTRRGVPVVISSGAQQRLLGLLALEADRFVTADEIADVLWGFAPPSGWRNRVHAHISQLRQLLEPSRQRRDLSAVLPGSGDGYRLDLPDDQIDASRFYGRLADARAAEQRDDPRSACDLYEEALGCWRGPILAGADGRLSGRPTAEALHRARLSATLGLADIATPAGRDDRAVVWLQVIAVEEPLHEGVHSRLMTAMARTGQQDKALGLYRDLRARLADELGVDPSADTQAAHRTVLQTGTAASNRPGAQLPAQLPMATPAFAGRDEIVTLLVNHLTGPRRAGEIPAPRVVAVHGMAGVGKTALTLQVAHRIRKHYPEGQLFADLRGETDHPSPAGQVLSGFLRSLGVAPSDIPADVSERSAVLRSCLAGRRVLMVLDDAKGADQVLPLLPSDSGNDVLITSRNQLIELPVTRHRLEPLSVDASLSVLGQYVPGEQVAADPSAASRIAAYCAGLPIALRIAAARAHTGDTLDDIARTLSDASQRVDHLHAGQLAMERSLQSAYRNISPLAQNALRRLAVLPTGTVPAWAVQVVLDEPDGDARSVLAELAEAHLVSAASRSDREARHYVLHDLVKLHLRAMATEDDLATIDHVIAAWLRLADEAMRRLGTRALRLDPLGVTTPIPKSTAIADPHTWFDGEHRNLIDALQHSAQRGSTTLAAGLLNALTPYLRIRHMADEWRECRDLVVTNAEKAGNIHAWAYACDSTVRLAISTDDIRSAVPVAEQGLELFQQAGDLEGHAQMLYHLQYLKRRLGDIPTAVQIATALVTTHREHGAPGLVAAAHQALGVIHREYLDDLDKARFHLEQALSLTASDTASRDHAQISYSLATVYIRQGEHAKAEPLLTHALTFMRATNDTTGIASILTRLSDILPIDKAADALDEALAVARTMRHKETEAHVYESLSRLSERAGALPDSIRHMTRAADVYRTLDAPSPLARVTAEIARLQDGPAANLSC